MPPSPEAPPASPREQTSASAWKQRKLGFGAQAALGGPFGLLGAVLEANPVPQVALTVGAGAGAEGPQLGGGVRFRPWPGGNEVWSIGATFSAGEYKDRSTSIRFDPAKWLNVEVSLEVRQPGLVWLRPFAGVGLLLNPRRGQCATRSCGDPSGELLLVGLEVVQAYDAGW